MIWALPSKCTTLRSSGIDSSVTDSPPKNLRHNFFYRIALFNPQRKKCTSLQLAHPSSTLNSDFPASFIRWQGVNARRVKIAWTLFDWQQDRCQRIVLSSQKLRKVFFYTRSTPSITYFFKPKTSSLLRQIISPIKMKTNSYGFLIWKRRHLENIGRPGSTAKCRYGGRHSGTQLIPGLYCRSGTTLVAMFWAFNLFRFGLVNARELPKSLNTTWTLFTSKTQENFVTDRLPTKERKLAKYDRLYNTKTF